MTTKQHMTTKPIEDYDLLAPWFSLPVKKSKTTKKKKSVSLVGKAKALRMIAEMGCTVETVETEFEVFAPNGYAFRGGESSLICFDYADIIERLQGEELMQELSN